MNTTDTLLAQGEHLTSRCQGRTDDLARQWGWAPEGALLPQLCAWLHRHIRKELQQLAIEGQQRAAQLMGQHHELGVVAGALVT
jgi:hypothetical protein